MEGPFPFKINRSLCKKCGICIASCPVQVYEPGIDGVPEPTQPQKCIRCNLCFLRCPDFAIDTEVEK